MSNQCKKIKQEYENLKTLKNEFNLEMEKLKMKKTVESGNLDRAKKLKAKFEQKRDALSEKLWGFEGLSQERFRENYKETIDGYKEFDWLKTLSSGKEGIIDEKGKEWPIPTLSEIKKGLMEKRELFAEKFALMKNPRVHLTPFALSTKAMSNDYSDLIEKHFVEERVEGDDRIPDNNKTRLFGRDGEPLLLRTDKQNVSFSDWLKNLSYFPEWEDPEWHIKTKEGITKEKAIAQIGGWRIIVTENIPKAPQKGESKLVKKEIKIKGETKEVQRKAVEGGLNAAQQYKLLKQQNEEGFTPEDWLSFAMLYLRKNNTILDDDEGISYHCRLLGVETINSDIPAACWNYNPVACWNYNNHQVCFYLIHSPFSVVRAAVVVPLKI